MSKRPPVGHAVYSDSETKDEHPVWAAVAANPGPRIAPPVPGRTVGRIVPVARRRRVQPRAVLLHQHRCDCCANLENAGKGGTEGETAPETSRHGAST
eukprot:3480322-Prymnesium_polylepis.2